MIMYDKIKQMNIEEMRDLFHEFNMNIESYGSCMVFGKGNIQAWLEGEVDED